MARRVPKKEWLLVRTQPNREQWAAHNIRQQSLQAYLPMIYNQRAGRREPLFSSYLFVQVVNRVWGFLSSTMGVSSVVIGTAGEPGYVNSKIIRELKRKENKRTGLIELPKAPELIAGQSTIIVKPGHLFGGQIGLYDGMIAKDRARILLANAFPAIIDRRLIEAA